MDFGNIVRMPWISVKERLPEADVCVLVVYVVEQRGPTITLGMFDKDRGWHWCFTPSPFRDQHRVTHWQPLPPLPDPEADT